MAVEPICYPGEIWKPVLEPRLAEPLEASSHGRIRRVERSYWVRRTDGVRPFLATRPLRLAKPILRVGYPAVCVKMTDGSRPYVSIHVLVCWAFRGAPPSDEHEVAHWDGNPLNPVEENLRWVTPLGNALDRERHGRTSKGERQPNSVLTDQDVAMLRASWQSGAYKSHTALARDFGVHRSTVTRAVLGQTWRHIP